MIGIPRPFIQILPNHRSPFSKQDRPDLFADDPPNLDLEDLSVKKSVKKLALSRETLRTLDDSGLKAWGGFRPYGGDSGKNFCPTVDTRQVSICLTCTGPLDSCPLGSDGCA